MRDLLWQDFFSLASAVGEVSSFVGRACVLGVRVWGSEVIKSRSMMNNNNSNLRRANIGNRIYPSGCSNKTRELGFAGESLGVGIVKSR